MFTPSQENPLSQYAVYTNEHEAAALSFFPPTRLRKFSWKLSAAVCIIEGELRQTYG